jgi:hypothetical protein
MGRGKSLSVAGNQTPHPRVHSLITTPTVLSCLYYGHVPFSAGKDELIFSAPLCWYF